MSTVIANAVLRPADDKVMLRKSGCIMQSQQYEYSSVYEDLNNNNLINMPGDLGNGNATITPYFGDSKMRVGEFVKKRNEKKSVGIGVIVELSTRQDGEQIAVVKWNEVHGIFQYKVSDLESIK